SEANAEAVDPRAEEPPLLARQPEHAVDGDSGHLLCAARPHDARLSPVEVEPLLVDDLPHDPQEEANWRIVGAREGEVIGVARVVVADRTREAGEPLVELPSDRVTDTRARRGSLRAVAMTDRDVMEDAVDLDGLSLSFGHQ